jgi:hypothetical protein
MFERFERSWNLAGQCFAVLRQDKSLLLFPLFSAIAMVLIAASFFIPLSSLARAMSAEHGAPASNGLAYVWLFVFYCLQFTVVNFFNTALVEVALRRFDGQDATVGDGLRRAWARLPVIVAYSVVAATVGTVLRAIEERVGFIGRIVIGLIGFVWAVATALVVPVLAAEDVGPVEAIRRSGELIRKTWCEEIIGNAGIGLVFTLIMLVAIVAGGLATASAFGVSAGLGVAVLAAAVACCAFLFLAQVTLQGIYAAALYRYADGDAATGGLDANLLGNAFRPRS